MWQEDMREAFVDILYLMRYQRSILPLLNRGPYVDFPRKRRLRLSV